MTFADTARSSVQHRFDKNGDLITFGDGSPSTHHSPRAYYIEKFSSYLEDECGPREYQGGSFSVSTFTRVAEVRRVIDIILSELELARTDPPSQQELDSARARAVGGFQLGLETSNALLAALVNLDIYGLPENSIDTYRSRVRATTIEDTARLANQLIHPERAAIVLVGPADALVTQLVGLGPVEVITS